MAAEGLRLEGNGLFGRGEYAAAAGCYTRALAAEPTPAPVPSTSPPPELVGAGPHGGAPPSNSSISARAACTHRLFTIMRIHEMQAQYGHHVC